MKPIRYNDYPIDKCVAQAEERINALGARGIPMTVRQKWTCRHCGSRQTMEDKNVFHRSGRCEACGQITFIQKCNYMALIGGAADVTVD